MLALSKLPSPHARGHWVPWVTQLPTLPAEAFAPGRLRSDNFLLGLRRGLQLTCPSAAVRGFTAEEQSTWGYISQPLAATSGKWKAGRSLLPSSWPLKVTQEPPFLSLSSPPKPDKDGGDKTSEGAWVREPSPGGGMPVGTDWPVM